MKISIKTMKKKTFNENEVIQYSPETETLISDVLVKAVDKIVPLITINEGNIYTVGYIPEDKRMIIHFTSIQHTVEGFELGVRPEPFNYVYDGIEQYIYDGFLASSNKIDYFEKNIKGNYFFHREEIW